MVDSPLAVKDLNRLNGSLYLTQQLNGGTALGKELAAGAIWKVRNVCVCSTNTKHCYYIWLHFCCCISVDA